MNPQLTFVTRLRRERLRTGISLDDIATQNRIKVELLEARALWGEVRFKVRVNGTGGAAREGSERHHRL